MIHKDDFLDDYNTFAKENIKWIDILSKIKTYVTYDRDKKYKNKRGFLIGIKKNEIDYFDE